MKKILCFIVSIFVCIFVINICVDINAASTTYSATSYSNTKQNLSLTTGTTYNISGSYTFKDEYQTSHTVTISEEIKLVSGYNFLSSYYLDEYYSYFLYVIKSGSYYQIYFEFDDYSPATDDTAIYDYTSYSSSYGLQSYSLTFKSKGVNKPTISGVTEGSYYNSYKKVTYSDLDGDITSATYQVNGGTKYSFTSGSSVGQQGKITITVNDEMGNSVAVNYYQDLTYPTISGVSANAKYNTYKTISYSDNYGISSAYYQVNGGSKVTLSNNTSIQQQGTILITITDLAGNVKTITYYQDVTAPTINAPNLVTVYANNPASINDIKALVTVTDNICSSSQITVTYEDHFTGYEEIAGTYYVYVYAVDMYNNSSTKTIRIDVKDVSAPRVFFGMSFARTS